MPRTVRVMGPLNHKRTVNVNPGIIVRDYSWATDLALRFVLADEVEDSLGPAVDGEPGAVGNALLRTRDVHNVPSTLRVTRTIGTLLVGDDDDPLALREVLVYRPDCPEYGS